MKMDEITDCLASIITKILIVFLYACTNWLLLLGLYRVDFSTVLLATALIGNITYLISSCTVKTK